MKKEKKSNALNTFLFASALLWASSAFLGYSPAEYMRNDYCFKYLSCNSGFFGYDFVIHFLSGLAVGVFIFWLGSRWPILNIRYKNRWKTALVALSLVTLVGVGWEFFEFSFDQSKDFFKEINIPTLNIKAQPSLADTMGDLFADIAGGAIPALAYALRYNLAARRKRNRSPEMYYSKKAVG